MKERKRDAIKRELEQIRQANSGLLTAHAVVDFAKRKNTALHSQFEWDDTKAGHQWRLQQARQVIRVHVEVLSEDTEPVSAFVSLKSDRYNSDTGGGYRSTSDVLSNADWREELLAEAHDDMNRLRRKYSCLKELSEVFAAMKRVRKPRKKKKAS